MGVALPPHQNLWVSVSKYKNTTKFSVTLQFISCIPINYMKKMSHILLLVLSLILTNKASSFETKLSPQGSDKYNLSIKGDAKSSEKNLRDVFQNKVNEICGTRFEIISIKMEYESEEGAKINVLNGTFKCFVKSQM